MKAGLVASIFALDAITQAGLSLHGDVQVQSVVKEEITGNGAAALFAEGFIADAILSPEPTDEQLVRTNAGVIKFRLEARGRPAHPREPESGQSAIDLMIRLIGHLRRLEAGCVAEQIGKPLFEDLPNPVALTIGTITGGDWIASAPSNCVAEGRIGFYPDEDPKARAAEVEAFPAQIRTEDPVFAGDLVTLTWVGVMHPGDEFPEGRRSRRPSAPPMPPPMPAQISIPTSWPAISDASADGEEDSRTLAVRLDLEMQLKESEALREIGRWSFPPSALHCESTGRHFVERRRLLSSIKQAQSPAEKQLSPS